MLVSRSTEESHLYMQLHPCECGECSFEWRERRVKQSGDGLLVAYLGECDRCGQSRMFEFILVPEPSPPPPALGGESPSQIIDPGEFLSTSQALAATVAAEPAALADDDFHAAFDALAFAAASLEEVLKFIPEGCPAVPPDSLRSAVGRALLESAPELFTRSHLEATRDTYRALLARYEAAAHPAD